MTKILLYEEQLNALAALVEAWAIKRDKHVKGPFTSGEYVTYALNAIFTPAGWSFTILSGPEVVTLNESSAYTRLVGRLSVRFADGSQAHQDDIGIWPLVATGAQNGGTLETTAAERYETAEKAARTDCLKNAARNLGTYFGPTSDLQLLEHIKRQAHLAANGGTTRSAAQDTADLFGEEPPQAPPKPPEAAADGTGLEHLLTGEILNELPQPDMGNGRDIDAIETLGDLWTACLEDFGLDRSHALKELGVTKQEHLAEHPRDLYRQIAAARDTSVLLPEG